MAQVSSQISLLEKRLEALESRVGEGKIGDEQIIQRLHDVQLKISTAATGKDKIQNLWKRMVELNDLFDPQVTDKLTITDDVKAGIILAEEEHFREQATLLGQVDEMKNVLDSEHIKAAPGMSERLQPLGLVQIDQLSKVQNLSDDVKQLLEAYNSIINLLSKQFIQWEDTLTKYEIAKKVRKSSNY